LGAIKQTYKSLNVKTYLRAAKNSSFVFHDSEDDDEYFPEETLQKLQKRNSARTKRAKTRKLKAKLRPKTFKLKDELYGQKMLRFVRSLQMELPKVEKWTVTVEAHKLKHFAFEGKKFPNMELAVCFVYQHSARVKPFGGYISSNNCYYFEGGQFDDSNQRYSGLGLTMLKSFAVNDAVYGVNDFVYYRWREVGDSDKRYNIGVGKISVIFKHSKQIDVKKKKVVKTPPKNKQDNDFVSSSSSESGDNDSSESDSEESEGDRLRKAKRQKLKAARSKKKRDKRNKEALVIKKLKGQYTKERNYDVSIVLMELTQGGSFLDTVKPSIQIDELVLPTDQRKRPKFFMIRDCDVLANVTVGTVADREKDMQNVPAEKFVFLDKAGGIIEAKMRIPLFVEALKRSEADHRTHLPKPFLKLGGTSGKPREFITAQEVNKEENVCMSDFVFYGQSHNADKTLTHNKSGFENYFYPTSKEHISLVHEMDAEKAFSWALEEFMGRENTIEQLLVLKYAWPHVGVHPNILDEFIRDPIYKRRQQDLFKQMKAGELETLAKFRNIVRQLPSELRNEVQHCTRKYEDTLNFQDRVVVTDDSPGLQLFRSTGFPDVDDAAYNYANEYIKRTTSAGSEGSRGFEFRSMQREIISCAFSGTYDALVALPTSTGKTLPIVVNAKLRHFFKRDGTKRGPKEKKPFCLLLAPRTATCDDLFDTIKNYFNDTRKVVRLGNTRDAAYKADYRCSTFTRLRETEPIVVIATVQLFIKGTLRPELFDLASMGHISCIAFDECQEIANSGENTGSFQSDFRSLGDLLRPHDCRCKEGNTVCNCFAFQSVPMLLTSATCNMYVQKRCTEILHLGRLKTNDGNDTNLNPAISEDGLGVAEPNSKLVCFEQPAYRENLEYIVESRLAKNSKMDTEQAKKRVKSILEDLPASEFAIVFCLKPKTVKMLHKYLLTCPKLKNKITLSHGNTEMLSKTEASKNESLWRTGKKTIMISNNKFSLGIDKKNVRLVIQYALPPNLDDYIQASGRAGRDGKPSKCILLYRYNDIFTAQRTTDHSATEMEKLRNKDSRRLLISYCLDAQTCRHRLMDMALHSGRSRQQEAERCLCDNCNQSRSIRDLTVCVNRLLCSIVNDELSKIKWKEAELRHLWKIEINTTIRESFQKTANDAFYSVLLCLTSLDILTRSGRGSAYFYTKGERFETYMGAFQDTAGAFVIKTNLETEGGSSATGKTVTLNQTVADVDHDAAPLGKRSVEQTDQGSGATAPQGKALHESNPDLPISRDLSSAPPAGPIVPEPNGKSKALSPSPGDAGATECSDKIETTVGACEAFTEQPGQTSSPSNGVSLLDPSELPIAPEMIPVTAAKIVHPKVLPQVPKRAPKDFYHEPFVESFVASTDHQHIDTLTEWKARLLEMDHTEGAIEYSGTLVVHRGQWHIELNEPMEYSNRAMREFSSWRFFKLRIPKHDKIDEAFLREFLTLGAQDRCLPFAEKQFFLELCTLINDDDGTKAIFIVKLKGELDRTATRTTSVHASAVQEWHINTEHNEEMTLGKYMKRFKLALSKTTPTVALEESDIFETETADIYRTSNKGKVLMNDGCGYIDEGTFKNVFNRLQNSSPNADPHYPTAIQIRIGSAKGVLLRTNILESDMFGEEIKKSNCKVILPQSMVKFNIKPRTRTVSQRTIDVNRTNIDYCRNAARLNRENIFLLEARGIKHNTFSLILKEWMDAIKVDFVVDVRAVEKELGTMSKTDKTQTLLEKYKAVDKRLIELLTIGSEDLDAEKFENRCGLRALYGGFSCGSEPFLCEIAERVARRKCKKNMEKFKIEVKKSRRLMLIPDPSGKLAPGECFANITFGEDDSGPPIGILQDEIVAVREPSYFHGDVVVLKCKEIQELKAYTNVLILSVQVNEEFPYSVAELMSGGDFDGDMAFVSWDKRLIPKRLTWEERRTVSSIVCREDDASKNSCAKEAGAETVHGLDFETRLGKMIDATVQYRQTADVWISKLANMQRLWWDNFGVQDPKSLELGKYCFHAVDRPKALVINGKSVGSLLKELDAILVQKELARRSTRVPVDSEDLDSVQYKLPTYDFRAYDYTYKSNSILGQLYKTYMHNLSQWAQLNTDRDLTSNSGRGGELDEHLMRYKDNYFKSNFTSDKESARWQKEAEIKKAVGDRYDRYVQELNKYRNHKRRKELWYDLISKHHTHFKTMYPEVNERRVAAVICYELLKTREYTRNPVRVINAGKYSWHVCSDELNAIKAEGIGTPLLVAPHLIPSFMKSFPKKRKAGYLKSSRVEKKSRRRR
jgi:superfamily II DNA helicase RecQ